MRPNRWNWLQEFRKLWESPQPEPASHARRIFSVQRNLVLPAKLVILAFVFYYLFFSSWKDDVMESRLGVVQTLQQLTIIYILFTAGVASFLLVAKRFPLRWVTWLVVLTGLVDGAFVASMMPDTGGFDSSLFWIFPGLIVLNALSIPLAAPQIILNLSLSAFFMGQGIWHANSILNASNEERTPPDETRIGHQSSTNAVISSLSDLERDIESLWPKTDSKAAADDLSVIKRNIKLLRSKVSSSDAEAKTPNWLKAVSPETFLLRLIVLWLLTACCYGLQVLAVRQRQVEEEAREFAARQGQLRTAGRLAAEIAHQVKNPLAIINNATFSLRRALTAGKTNVISQLDIIQEEIERSDRIITQLMGYARLAEGRVEKLDVTEELERALDEVFPKAIGYEVEIHRDFATNLPTLVMQRGHLNTVLVNLMQNAREAIEGRGHVRVGTKITEDFSVMITIQDDGPGIPAEQSERIFEAYFTTKEKGTGLGLAIVKHNVDLYGGTIRVESELGKGARFVVLFPARAFNQPDKEA